MLSSEYCEIFRNSFFEKAPLVAAFGYSNQSKIAYKITASKSQGQHATHPVSVVLKVYVLPLKQKSSAGFPIEFCEILEQLLSRTILGAAFEQKIEEENDAQWRFVVSDFNFFQRSYLLIHETMFFLHIFA